MNSGGRRGSRRKANQITPWYWFDELREIGKRGSSKRLRRLCKMFVRQGFEDTPSPRDHAERHRKSESPV